MKDPYLIPGQICEIYDEFTDMKMIRYFYKYNLTGKPCFLEFKPIISRYPVNDYVGKVFENYSPIGTEWDFALDWAVCSTVDKDGEISFWGDYEFIEVRNTVWYGYDAEHLSCGICPEKSRYENEAWKTSLRMRPEWARR